MQAFKRLFYCIYVFLTIAFKVVSLGVRSRGTFVRACGCLQAIAQHGLQADGRPSKGKKASADGHGQTINVWNGSG